ncbi:hypothetical protein C484_18682 [Natrialba taiwanensis DSM 12281]|uniref:Uncharacterized protein n=1 Tax=Natrialba taiwanensis DSM 12281 TaxID=1230458 RepID=L9ZLT7_9EURY|nr:hypothetical protein C484_18682 [Natrialba taiwanensis DSM 12281]
MATSQRILVESQYLEQSSTKQATRSTELRSSFCEKTDLFSKVLTQTQRGYLSPHILVHFGSALVIQSSHPKFERLDRAIKHSSGYSKIRSRLRSLAM